MKNTYDFMGYFRGVYRGYLKAPQSPKEARYDDIDLPVLATQSGGEVLVGEKKLGEQIERCISDANSYYELTFKAPIAAHVGEYHGIEIQMAQPGLTARTRTGYYTEQ